MFSFRLINRTIVHVMSFFGQIQLALLFVLFSFFEGKQLNRRVSITFF